MAFNFERMSSDQGGNEQKSEHQLEEERKEQERAKRREHREVVGGRIKDAYLPEDGGKALEQLLDDLGDQKEELGVSLDRAGKVRLRNPQEEGLPGAYYDKEVVRALVLGFQNAETPTEQWAVISDACDYLGVEPPEKPSEEEVEASGGMMSWINKRASSTAGFGMLLGLLAIAGAKPLGETKGFEGPPQEDARVEAVVEGATKEAREGMYQLQQGETLTSVAQDIFREYGVDNPPEDVLQEAVEALARDSNVEVAEWGVEGDFDDESLPIGFEVDTSNARAAID